MRGRSSMSKELWQAVARHKHRETLGQHGACLTGDWGLQTEVNAKQSRVRRDVVLKRGWLYYFSRKGDIPHWKYSSMATKPPLLPGRCAGLPRVLIHLAGGLHLEESAGPPSWGSLTALLWVHAGHLPRFWGVYRLLALPHTGWGKRSISLRILNPQQCRDPKASFSTIGLEAMAQHNYL